MFKEFKEFAMRGNVVDMAVGITIGAAFGTIIKSLVDDIIMPPIGLLLSNGGFPNIFTVIKSRQSWRFVEYRPIEPHIAKCLDEFRNFNRLFYKTICAE